MARYRVGPAGYFRAGVRYYAGDEVTLPDDERPSRTFFPLDPAGRAAFKKHRIPVAEPPAAAEADSMPATMSQAQRQGRSPGAETA